MIYYDQYGNPQYFSSESAGAGASGAGASGAAGAAANAAEAAAGAAGAASGLKGSFSKLKSWGSKTFPNARKHFKNMFGGTGAFDPAGFDWNFRSSPKMGPGPNLKGGPGVQVGKTGPGLTLFGKNVGTGANILSGIMQGIDFAQGVSSFNDAQSNSDDLLSDIRTSAMGNPLLSSYLTSDQLNLLNDIRSNRYGNSVGADDFFEGMGSGLGDAAMSALGGLAVGGLPGALIGGIGTLINSGVDNLSETTNENTAELQALYQALRDAEMQYKSMKRPNFTGLGIQQQYQNMYA
jgi:hypothetical protein